MTWRVNAILRSGAVCGTLLITAALSAQQHTRVIYAPTCGGCSITLDRVAVIGSSSDPVLIGGVGGIERDSRGRYYTSSYDRVKVAVFDSNGAFITSFGGEGNGPGEFGTASSILSGIEQIRIGARDTVFVFSARSRLDVFSPAYRHVRTVTLAPVNRSGAALTATGEFIYTAAIRTARQAGQPYHVVGASGAAIRSFGNPPGAIADSARVRASLFVMTHGLRSFWGAHNYRLRHWSTDGNLLGGYEISGAPWLLPASGPSGTPNRRPASDVYLAGVDSHGRLWVNGISYAPTSAGRYDALYRLEIFDPASRRIVATQSGFSGVHRFISGTDLVYVGAEDASGIASYTIFRATLKNP